MMKQIRGLKVKFKLSDLFFFILFLFLVLYIVSTQTNTGYRFYIIRSNSMKPNAVAGDVAVIKSLDQEEIQPGTIIAFWNPNNEKQILIHRVIGLAANGFVTKGDANEHPDAEPVSLDKVIGIYRYRIPLLGFFFAGLRSVIQQLFEERSVGWYIIGGGGLLLIGTQVGSAFIARKQDKGKHEEQ